MIVFILLGLITAMAQPLLKEARIGNSKKYYCILMFILMSAIMGLRSEYTGGVDTNLVYLPAFRRICAMPFLGVIATYKKDSFFYILTKIFTFFSKNEQLYLGIIAAFVVGSFCKFVYKHSKYAPFSFLLFLGLGYYGIEFQMLRHSIATSVLLFSYDYLRERKLLKFIAVVLLASLFHSSALVFLCAFPITSFNIGFKQWIVVFCAVVSSVLLKNNIISLLRLIFQSNSRYLSYLDNVGSTAIRTTGALILLATYTAAYLLVNKAQKLNTEFMILFNLGALSICSMFMVSIIGEFHRISMFFGMFMTILLPNAFSSYWESIPVYKNERNKIKLLLLGTEMLFLAYFVIFNIENAGLLNYQFFWQ